MTKNNSTYNKTNFLLYTGKHGEVRVEVFLQDETLWLTQKAIGRLFGKERSVITKHLKNIFDSGELDEKSNVQKMHIPLSDKPVKYYNLDVIISVGYQVNSYQATQFRILATKTLKDKGKVSALEAKLKADREYEKYRIVQDKNYISDFDKEIQRITGKKEPSTENVNENNE